MYNPIETVTALIISPDFRLFFQESLSGKWETLYEIADDAELRDACREVRRSRFTGEKCRIVREDGTEFTV
jgi:hypothetical protein